LYTAPKSKQSLGAVYLQGDHSPDNVKFPDDSPTVRGTRHVKCYSYHARTSVTVSGGGRNATVHHDPKVTKNIYLTFKTQQTPTKYQYGQKCAVYNKQF